MGVAGPSRHPLAFFVGVRAAFDAVLAQGHECSDPIEHLVQLANEIFDRSVTQGGDRRTALACHGGCSGCCTIRVAATAPEIFAIARNIRSLPEPGALRLVQRIAAADRVAGGLDPRQHMAAALPCPLMENDLCIAYCLRPLACRGHASFDEEACRRALRGSTAEVPLSAVHAIMRSLVQNALQAALRDRALAWDGEAMSSTVR